jgi:hypothetical protein
MYTLNFLVNFDVVNGRFSGDATTPGALNTSMNWLKLAAEPADPNPPAFNPETADWVDIGQAGTLFIPKRPAPAPEDNICIRVAPDPDGAVLTAAAQVQIVASFGRSVRARQERSTPFTESGSAKTVFVFPSQIRNTSASWFMVLGPIAVRPIGQNQTHRYEFSVGVVVTMGGVKRHFGEDPEMDVGT